MMRLVLGISESVQAPQLRCEEVGIGEGMGERAIDGGGWKSKRWLNIYK